jgi:3-dehydroquinate synthase
MHPPSHSLERTITVSFAHRIFFTRSVFSPQNPLLAEILAEKNSPRRPKALAVLDENVARAFPGLTQSITACFSRQASPAVLVREPLLAPGGEAVKNNRDLYHQLHREIEGHGIDRHSFVLAIGGGALLDAAGFAAATAHRGVRLVRLPTTSLSQADGGVGVKNGINAFGKKNFLGTFAPPFAVINDSEFLGPLPAPEKRAGLIEAIKVALIRDAAFFAEIENSADALARLDGDVLERIIRRCAELHVEHIAASGDPFELGSARPLDFGHWSAHKLEQMSGFAISHGAAVAHGIALDVIYSSNIGLLPPHAAERALALIQKLGFALFDPLMAPTAPDGACALLAGLEEFREHLGGELTITLLRDIGRGEEVHAINIPVMRESLRELELRARALSQR